MAEPSYWFKEVPDQGRFPSLEGNLRFDAVVMGGGIAGISAAYFLSRAGVKIALLEMGTLASGDSGYTTAFATHFLDSTDATLRAWQASEAGLQLFRHLVEKERIECEWKDIDGIGFTRKPDPTAFRQDYEALWAADPTLEYLPAEKASDAVGFPVSAAFRKSGREGQFHIRKFLFGLAERLVSGGGKILEQSEVTALEGRGPITLSTPTGSVTCDWLVVAAGPPPRQFFPLLADQLGGAITYVIQASYPGAKPFGPSLFWDDLAPYHYYRWVSDTDLILGGEDWVMREKRPTADPHQALVTWLKEVSGDAAFNVVNTWQGTIYYTPDIFPYIGSHPAYGPRTVFLTGWAGNGMAHGLLAGNIAADLVQRKENPYQGIFAPHRWFKGLDINKGLS